MPDEQSKSNLNTLHSILLLIWVTESGSLFSFSAVIFSLGSQVLKSAMLVFFQPSVSLFIFLLSFVLI